MKRNLWPLVLMMGWLLAASHVNAIQLPQLFQNGMVLQRDHKVPVWGKAVPGEQISVSWQHHLYQAVAQSDSCWRVDLPPMPAGGPFQMRISGSSSEALVLDDILVGDVWLCSGQSNMELPIARVYWQYPDEIDRFDNPQVRLLRVPKTVSTHGVQTDIPSTQWQRLTRESAMPFSALATFYALHLQQTTGVAQAVIDNSWGGTPIEAWLPADSLRGQYDTFLAKTRLYDDADLVSALKKTNELANNRWWHLLNERDPGVAQQWASAHYDDSSWPTVGQYGHIAGQQQGNYTGSLWLRQHVSIDRRHAGQPALLLLGTLFDQDYTYVNGQEVGRTYYQYPPRRYMIPAGLLKEGDNVITIRFVNKQGIPHFIPQKPYMLIFGERLEAAPGGRAQRDSLLLGDAWLVHQGALMPSCPASDVDLHYMPTTLYHAMLYPLAPYALKGVLWYQGESNTGRPDSYADLLRKLMGSWRQLWEDPQLPFCIVQLANFMEPSEGPQNSQWAALREAQRTVAEADARAELACIIDLGETVDIHPLMKKEVALRAAHCMEKVAYGQKMALSPQLVAVRCKPTKMAGTASVVLTFNQTLDSDEIAHFEVAGTDGHYISTTAVAKGKTVVLTSPISHPMYVRYAWKDNPLHVNLFGKNGWPVSPFQAKICKE